MVKRYQQINGDKRKNHQAIFLGCLVIITALLAAIRLVVVNSLVDSSAAANKIENRTRELKSQNDLLAQDLYRLSSLSSVAIRAARMGFGANKSLTYMPRTSSVAVIPGLIK